MCCCANRDSRQITYLVSNILRWQRRLDFTIAHLTGKPCTKLEPRVHAILRLAVHELLFQQLPAHAVSEHVNLAKTLVRPAAGTLVNGELLQGRNQSTNQSTNQSIERSINQSITYFCGP